jgi:hypothetical protein
MNSSCRATKAFGSVLLSSNYEMGGRSIRPGEPPEPNSIDRGRGSTALRGLSTNGPTTCIAGSLQWRAWAELASCVVAGAGPSIVPAP